MEPTIDVDALRAKVVQQGAVVRQLKKDNAGQNDLVAAIETLQHLKKELEEAVKKYEEKDTFDRAAFDKLTLSRMFVVPSFEIYGGIAGLYDFGPAGCALKANFINLWKRHFILEEEMLELECTNLTPYCVLKTSGHVDKFTDLMVKDVKTGDCYRADKLLEAKIDELLEDITLTEEQRQELDRIRIQADSYSPEELEELFAKYDIKATITGNDLTKPYPFNLMFATNIGPEGNNQGFLRPETAQGMFVNFKRLLDYNNHKFPFAAAQVGTGFRNEISPRAGLLRVREFPMAEIEHFCNPKDKSHPKFKNLKDLHVPLFPREHQKGDGKIINPTLEEAVNAGTINNETLAYFLGRVYQFLTTVGIDNTRLRFRQHLETEMAHYSSDCWDAEIKLSYGWTECVGIADRSCFDLTNHSRVTKVDLSASVKYDTPISVEVFVPNFNNKVLGMNFKKEQNLVKEYIKNISESDLELTEKIVNAFENNESYTVGPLDNGNTYTLTKDMVTFKKSIKKIHEDKFVPSVIEPSFGVGRLLYAILEHSFYIREDSEKRNVMKFRPCVAPVKCSIFPLSNSALLQPIAESISRDIKDLGFSTKIDTTSASIGRRYARTDEIGIPFAVTVDFDTVTSDSPLYNTVTVRERDSMQQVRVPVKDLTNLIHDLVLEKKTWAHAVENYPVVDTKNQD
ncbi:hypothetical protein WA158_005788 [Blastocystis sp. Blastoise]